MKEQQPVSRRMLVKSSVFGLLAASLPGIVYAKDMIPAGEDDHPFGNTPHDRYPAIHLDIVSEVVGVSHFNVDRLKELVDPRPELARSNWDWGFGDRESAIEAASHVGRRDIVSYLMSKGAIPTICTYAMLGEYAAVKAMIEAAPGVQQYPGPHGISLLQHARTGLQADGADKAKVQQVIDYLQSLGDADGKTYLNVEEADKAKYLGDYTYGTGKDDGFTIKLNMKKLLSLGKLGKSGGALFRTGGQEFTYQGAPSVLVKFDVQDGKVLSLTIHEPGLVLTATKI